MTKQELKYIKLLLERITPNDQHVRKAIAYVDKDLANYDARVGQLREQYEADFNNW